MLFRRPGKKDHILLLLPRKRFFAKFPQNKFADSLPQIFLKHRRRIIYLVSAEFAYFLRIFASRNISHFSVFHIQVMLS